MIESLRTDALMFKDLRVAQIASIILIVVGIIFVLMNAFKTKFEARYNE